VRVEAKSGARARAPPRVLADPAPRPPSLLRSFCSAGVRAKLRIGQASLRISPTVVPRRPSGRSPIILHISRALISTDSSTGWQTGASTGEASEPGARGDPTCRPRTPTAAAVGRGAQICCRESATAALLACLPPHLSYLPPPAFSALEGLALRCLLGTHRRERMCWT